MMLDATLAVEDTGSPENMRYMYIVGGTGRAAAKCILASTWGETRQQLAALLNMLSWPALRAIACPANTTEFHSNIPHVTAQRDDSLNTLFVILYASVTLLIVYNRWLYSPCKRAAEWCSCRIEHSSAYLP